MGASISCSLFETFATFWNTKPKWSRGPILFYTISTTSFLRHLKVVKNAVLYFTRFNEFVLLCLTQEVRIPQDKLLSLQASITKTLKSEFRSLQSIQSLIGSLNFVTRGVSPGVLFSEG